MTAAFENAAAITAVGPTLRIDQQGGEQSMANPGFDRQIIAAVLLTAGVMPVWSQSYPSRPITIVVPLAAGTGMDTITRLYGEKLAEYLGRPVIVENKPGGGFILATQSVIAAAADGHTLLVGAPVPLSINQTLYKQLPYDPEKDLIPIAHYAVTPFILVVTPSLPVRSVPEFIKYAKERSTPLNYSSPAGGGVPHYAVELIKQRFGLQLNHVPYRNSPQSIQDIAGGHVDFAFAEAGVSRPLIEDGKLRALAVSSKQRMPALPDIPAFAEVSSMPDFEIEAWHMLVAHAATPRPIANRLNAEMKRIMAAPDMKQRISNMGLIPLDPPAVADTESYIRSETVKWSAILKRIGLAGSM
jgi:tripartite-type tricarboxylate transporter receptor subunit TctC